GVPVLHELVLAMGRARDVAVALPRSGIRRAPVRPALPAAAQAPLRRQPVPGARRASAAGAAGPAGHRDRGGAAPLLPPLGASAVLLVNDPGRMVFDTKLSVDLNPHAYFAGLWQLWDPLNTLGALNNQTVGYAVPMAPFYLAGQVAHVPVWLTERMWMALI